MFANFKGVGIMNKERSDKWKETLIELAYMLTMLAQIKRFLTEEQYNKLKRNINEEYLKKRALYAHLDYQQLISQNNLVGV